ncbi:MAG: hypothetical protein R3Y50_08040 [Rikenellaceae bacterium]
MSKRFEFEERSTRVEIIETFGVSSKSLWEALTFKVNTSHARKLRAAARERGGVIVDFDAMKTYRACDTYFNEVPRQMVRIVSDRVLVVCNLEGDCDTLIEVDGKEVENFGRVEMGQMPMVFDRALVVVNGLK